MNSIKDNLLKRVFKLFLKYYSVLCQTLYYCQGFKCKLNNKDKVDYLLEKEPNFNIYQDTIQLIKHNDFKRFEHIVKENLIKNITIESPEINKKLKKELGEKEKIIDKKRKSKKTKSKELER